MLSPPESEELFAEIKIDPATIENPRFEKFPRSGPTPWLDRQDAKVRIAERLGAGLINEADAEQLRYWVEHGYIILKGAVEAELIDEIWAAYQAAIDTGVIQLHPEKISLDDPWPGRFLDPHFRVPEICRAMRHPEILRWIQLLMDRIPAPFQTITSHKGSQQGVHSDSIHMTTYPLGYLTAAWIALEDIHPDSGPLVYYSGSHRLPYLFSHELGIPAEDFHQRGYKSYMERYEPAIQRMIRDRQLEPSHFIAQKGDVLIWHANLLHGGSARRDLHLSRRALVCHYFVKGALCYHDLSSSRSRPFSGTCLVRIEEIRS